MTAKKYMWASIWNESPPSPPASANTSRLTIAAIEMAETSRVISPAGSRSQQIVVAAPSAIAMTVMARSGPPLMVERNSDDKRDVAPGNTDECLRELNAQGIQ